MNFKPKS